MKPKLLALIGLLIGASKVCAEPLVISQYSNEIQLEKKQSSQDQLTINGHTVRDWMASRVFQTFKFKGEFRNSITHLMDESKKLKPKSHTIGGFSIIHGLKIDQHIEINLQNVTTLEIINSLCASVDSTWRIDQYSIIIEPKQMKNRSQ